MDRDRADRAGRAGIAASHGPFAGMLVLGLFVVIGEFIAMTADCYGRFLSPEERDAARRARRPFTLDRDGS